MHEANLWALGEGMDISIQLVSIFFNMNVTYKTRASARRGMNTFSRYHFLMYKNNLSMTMILGKINGP